MQQQLTCCEAKILDEFTSLACNSSRNRYVCCNWGLLDSLLKIIPSLDNDIVFGMHNNAQICCN